MTRRNYDFQPGAILHAAIIGAFRAHGTTFAQWCRDNGVISTVGRQATHGQSAGENGKDILARMIAGAGEATTRSLDQDGDGTFEASTVTTQVNAANGSVQVTEQRLNADGSDPQPRRRPTISTWFRSTPL